MPDYRKDFFDFAPVIYLDCAYQGPFPRVTAARIQQAVELKCHPERLEAPEYFDLPERVRARLSRIVGADTSEVALTNSATQGIGMVAAGWDLSPGDDVVIASTNFPSNLFTWLHLRRLGVTVSVLNPAAGYVSAEDVARTLTPRTRILALDWVGYTTGARIDLGALGNLIHSLGGIFVVDGTQGVGALELAVHDLPVDVVAAAAYKWLLGPYGTGFAYIKKEVLDRLQLHVLNWLTLEGSDNFDALPKDRFSLPNSAKMFDVPETPNFLNLYGLEASLEFIERVGVKTVREHCVRLLDRLAEGLRGLGYELSAAAQPEHGSTILGFSAGSPELTERLHRQLRAENMAVSLRQGVIRVSPHLYNSEADIDRLLSLVSASGRRHNE
jgi:cysteine desulfurase / selenocysteine lyase